MAVLQQPVVSGNVFAEQIGDDLAPAGTFMATVIDIQDAFGVQRQKFQSTEIETVDLTCFLFGFRDQQGYEHRVASRRMKISGNEKSSLFAFLKSLLGRAPQYGWDYMALRGQQCLLTVEHVQKRDGMGVFAGIAALSPVPAGFGQSAPQAAPTAGARVQGSVGMAPAAVAPSPAMARPMAGQPVGRIGGPVSGPVAGVRPQVAPSPVPVNDPIPF